MIYENPSHPSVSHQAVTRTQSLNVAVEGRMARKEEQIHSVPMGAANGIPITLPASPLPGWAHPMQQHQALSRNQSAPLGAANARVRPQGMCP